MTDFDFIWRKQDEIRTVVDAVLGCGIWNLNYNTKREAIELELMTNLDEDTVSDLCCQFPLSLGTMMGKVQERSPEFVQ